MWIILFLLLAIGGAGVIAALGWRLWQKSRSLLRALGQAADALNLERDQTNA
jgi:hypothetical protein